MKQSLRILIVNNTLNGIAGTELYVLELAKHLVKLGHKPVAYSTDLGIVAEKLRAEGIPVTADLNTLGAKPDVIHGHHHLDTLSALLHFPDVPAVYFCHGWLPWEERPLRFPRIYKYVAVCDLTAERLIVEGGIPADKINILFNFVDLERFQQRPPLPDAPKRALAFSGYMNNDRLRLIESACERCGIQQLDKVGRWIGETHPHPENILGQYDLVFAKSRAALEALAVGAAVISCDGAGSMVTTENFERQRMANFGLSERQYGYHVDSIVHEIRQYNAQDARKVSDSVRATATKEVAIAHIIDLYKQAIEEHRSNPHKDLIVEMKAVSDYLRETRKDLDLKIPLPQPAPPKKWLCHVKDLLRRVVSFL